MKYLIILCLLGLFACEKEKLPTTPTVINGIVVDENEVPIPNVFVHCFGTELLGFRGGNDTPFYLQKQSEENGTFSFSQVIPNETDWITLKAYGVIDPAGFVRIPTGFKYAYFLNDQFISDRILSIDKNDNMFSKTLVVKIKQIKE